MIRNSRYDTSLEDRMVHYYSKGNTINPQLPKLNSANAENLYYLPHFKSRKNEQSAQKNISYFQ